jgi:hypothetical protein
MGWAEATTQNLHDFAFDTFGTAAQSAFTLTLGGE